MIDNAPESNDYSFAAPSLEELAPYFPSYELKAIIAQGGMGAVYHGVQTTLDRHVAIKILPAAFGQQQNFRDAFAQEARAMAKLNHPNLVAVYDSGEANGMPYIIMEYVPGETMHQATNGKQIPEEQTLQYIIEILKGIKHAHQNEVIHRDIKPANIIFSREKKPKLTDFGLTANVRHQGQMLGTPGYIAPEVIKNPVNIDQRTDIYSIGVLLHTLLTGITPTGTEKLRSAASIVRCNPKIDTVIQRATHPIMDMRYSNAQEMIDDLERLNQKPNTRIIPKTTNQKLSQQDTSVTIQNTDSHAPEQKKSNTLRNLIILAVIACCMVIAYDQLKKEQDKQERSDSIDQYLEQTGALKQNADKEEKLASIRERESPQESLSRLKRKLTSGSKSEFPKGSHLTEKNAYFLVNEAMDWHKAQKFAEQHGGHLGVASDQESKKAISQIVKNNESVWLGGSEGYWCNGDTWNSEVNEQAIFNGLALSLGNNGQLESSPIDESKPFIIQWPLKGSNVGSLAVQFRRTKERISEGSYFPPGTIALGHKRFLLVPRAVQWSTARNLAASSGGQLARPSTDDEIKLLALYASSFSTEKEAKYWIDVNSKNDAWSWSDGNLIDGGNSILDYLPNKPNQDTAATFEPSNKNLLAIELQNEKAAGFIVEWTSTLELPNTYLNQQETITHQPADKKSTDTTASDSSIVKDPPKSFTDLKNKAASLVKQYRISHAAELKKVKSSLEKDRKSIMRSIAAKDRKKTEDFFNDVLAEIKLGGNPPIKVPNNVHKKAQSLLKNSLDKLNRINKQHTQRLNNLHSHYSKNLKIEAVKIPELAFFFSDELTAIGENGTSLDKSFGDYNEIIESSTTDSEKEDADEELQELLDSL